MEEEEGRGKTSVPRDPSSSTSAPPLGELPDYWQRVESPVSKAQVAAFAGGALAFGALCGAAAALVIGQRTPRGKAGTARGAGKVKVTPSAVVFALKALAGGTNGKDEILINQ